MSKPGNSGRAKDSRKMDALMARCTEQPPSSVSLAQQAGVAASLWKCASPCVWTLSILTAGYVLVVDADQKGYFDSLPHAALMDCLKTKIDDGRVLSLIESFLQTRIMDGTEAWTPLLRRGPFSVRC